MSIVISLNPPLKAKDACPLRCVIVARISTEHQDKQSLEDQQAKCRRYIGDHFDGELNIVVIASRGSGEHLDREELFRLEQMIESRQIDLVIAEDLSRICRRRRAYDLCEMCQDHDVRLIAINDRVDTDIDGWEDSATMATWHHERSNRDTAERIKRSLDNRFDLGGVVQFTIYGYVKPPGAKHDRDLQKDPTAEPIIQEIFRRLEQGAFYAEIADWLNDQGARPGPYCRLPRWDGPMVRRFVHEPILKGIRVRNRKVTKRINKTGRRKTVKGEPSQLRVRQCPHLAFVDSDYYDHVIRLADERNQGYRRTNKGESDPRLGVSRKRTHFPGQHARCGICGRLMHWHGMKGRKVMLCSGAADYRCWNGLFVNGEECSQRIAGAVLQAISELPDFDSVFGQLLSERFADLDDREGIQRRVLEQKLKDVEQRLSSLMTHLEQRPESQTILDRLDELESQRKTLRYELKQLNDTPKPYLVLPAVNELRQRAVAALKGLAVEDPETCRLLRLLIPDLQIVPYQVCDGSDLVARAEFTLTLTSLLPPVLAGDSSAAVFTRQLVIDLCQPSQRVIYHQAAADLQARGLKEREIGERLGIAQSAVQRALRINRLMKSRGLTEPFIRLTELPEITNRLRRHRHPRFRFEPLDGYPRDC